MNEPLTIELREYGKGVEFTPTSEERSTLERFSHALVMRAIGASLVEVKSNDDFVGGVQLSRNTRVIVRPKMPIGSLLQLILIGAGVDVIPRLRGIDEYARGSVLDWLVMMLVLEVRRLVSTGLRRGYVTTEEPLQLIRGRIDFAKTLRKPWNAQTVVCRYTAFTINTRENQILVSTLDAMSRHALLPEIRHAVEETIAIFEGVSLRQIALTDFDRVQITRLNHQYEAAIALCRLFAKGAALEFGIGNAVGSGFFISMNTLFEQAVTNALRMLVPRVAAQRSIKRVEIESGFPVLPVTMIPDITILGSAQKPLLVLDTKYKKPIVTGQFGRSFDNGNIYQIVTYAKAARCPGMLVYPQVDEPVDVWMKMDDIRFGITTIDLSGDVRQALTAFAHRIAAMIREGASALAASA